MFLDLLPKISQYGKNKPARFPFRSDRLLENKFLNLQQRVSLMKKDLLYCGRARKSGGDREWHVGRFGLDFLDFLVTFSSRKK